MIPALGIIPGFVGVALAGYLLALAAAGDLSPKRYTGPQAQNLRPFFSIRSKHDQLRFLCVQDVFVPPNPSEVGVLLSMPHQEGVVSEITSLQILGQEQVAILSAGPWGSNPPASSAIKSLFSKDLVFRKPPNTFNRTFNPPGSDQFLSNSKAFNRRYLDSLTEFTISDLGMAHIDRDRNAAKRKSL